MCVCAVFVSCKQNPNFIGLGHLFGWLCTCGGVVDIDSVAYWWDADCMSANHHPSAYKLLGCVTCALFMVEVIFVGRVFVGAEVKLSLVYMNGNPRS